MLPFLVTLLEDLKLPMNQWGVYQTKTNKLPRCDYNIYPKIPQLLLHINLPYIAIDAVKHTFFFHFRMHLFLGYRQQSQIKTKRKITNKKKGTGCKLMVAYLHPWEEISPQLFTIKLLNNIKQNLQQT